MALWNQYGAQRGTVSKIANELGISHVAVSNMILRQTGKRPSFHLPPRTASEED